MLLFKLLMNQNNQYCYLIQEREFVKTGEHIYKVGKSSYGYKNSIAKFPKNSVVVLIAKVDDCNIALKNIINHFNEIFKIRTDIGKDYFEGDIHAIIRNFNRVAYLKDAVPKVVPNVKCEIDLNICCPFDPATWARL